MIKTHLHGWDFSPGQLLTPTDVAEMFRVSPATVAKWAGEGRLAFVRTLGGHRRYSLQQVEHFLKNPDSLAPAVVPPSV
ncbi:helix-turn-helix domain-containing protein [Actinomadura sp. 9N215]|uniref:helix-turn-helix domain-containing protein n=1 Tax=Actinomadura sp. 9N215 TaxID=3375150 RepID=UPI0037BD7571